MAGLPPTPIAPSDFFEGWLPRAFAELAADLPEELRQSEVQLGVLLEGEGGGEWLIAFRRGRLEVAAAPRVEAAFTVVQSVDDWRGALWEGRGGAIGRQAAQMFDPAAQPRQAMPGQLGGPPSPAMLGELEKLDGVIRMVVSGGTGGDWIVSFKLGPGAIPPEPTATLTISADDSDALGRGELDPMQAFMSGRILVTGDMTIVLQMQAIQMAAAARSGAGR